MQTRARAIVEQATQLEAALRRRDRAGAKRLAVPMAKGLQTLSRSLEAKVADFKKQTAAIEAALGANHHQRAMSLAQSLTAATSVFRDPSIQTVRRLSPYAELLLDRLADEDPQDALFLLAVTLWSEPVFSPEEAAMAAKALALGEQLEAALAEPNPKLAMKLTKELAPTIGPFAQRLRHRAQQLVEPSIQIRQALQKGDRSAVLREMTKHLSGLRTIGLPEPVMRQALADLIALYGQLADTPQSHRLLMALTQHAKGLSEEAIEKAKRFAALGEELSRLIPIANFGGARERIQDVLEDRALREASSGAAAPTQHGRLSGLMDKATTKAITGFLDSASAKIANVRKSRG